MLEARSYMRRSPFERRLSATIMLLIANVAVFLFQSTLQFLPLSLADAYYGYLPLSLEGLKHGFFWQLVSYQFLHVNVVHLFFNCWAMYVFGPDVEDALGKKPFLTLYFSSGVIGGMVQAAAGLLPRFAGPVMGASAAVLGLLAAFAMLFPDRVILLFFILPVRAKYLLILCAIGSLIGILWPQAPSLNTVHVAEAAHLGGMLAGVLFIRYAIHWHLPRWRRTREQPLRRLVNVPSQKSGYWSRSKSAETEDLPPDEFLSREVDPILDKISAHGIQSLTERERRILEAARTKIGKR